MRVGSHHCAPHVRWVMWRCGCRAREDIQIKQATENGATPLYATCQNSHVDVVRLLLARKEIAEYHKFTKIVTLFQNNKN